jgi:hypothetical protein
MSTRVNVPYFPEFRGIPNGAASIHSSGPSLLSELICLPDAERRSWSFGVERFVGGLKKLWAASDLHH